MAKKAPRQAIVEPLRVGIEEDLRTLRRQPGVLRADRLMDLPFLVEYLGDGSEQAAYDGLLELRRRHGRIEHTDIHAFFYTSGYRVGGDTLDVRLKRYAEAFCVVEKTALRRSDRGARKLSQLIRDGSEYARPWATLVVTQNGPTARVVVAINVVEDQTFRRPQVFVNGARLEGLTFDLEPTGDLPVLLYGSELIDDVPLGRTAGPDDPLLTVAIRWPQAIWPTWMVTAHMADARLHARLETKPSGTAEITVLWFDDAGDPDPGRPLALRQRTTGLPQAVPARLSRDH